MEAIKAINLTKRYKDLTAVDRLNVTVEEGELFSLLGTNGAGKTTAIKMLTCLTAPTEGHAYINGHSIISDSTQIKKSIGVCPQETALAESLTVKENLELFCGLFGFDKTKTKEKIKELSELFHLGEILSKKVVKLSGGWKRRVSISVALISEPKTIFLDEPTLGLDVIARSELWDIIRGIKGKTTVILTTHYLEEAEALSDRVGIMKNGKLLITDTPKKITEATGCEKFEDAFISIIKGAEI